LEQQCVLLVRPSRRRPRRVDVVTYRVRIDLKGTTPPLWRRCELASDLFLDDLHDVIQAAFGWTDSHLHRFGCGPEYYSHDTEYYLCPFDVEEGETGVPEDQVRLDEVLVEIGEKLFYTYDFGDDWQHTIRLEAVVCHEDSVPRRESVQKAGLLRKHRGKLLLTAQGRAMCRDPVTFWWLLAEKTPPRFTVDP
jgi:hypothetical protein